MLLEGLWCFAQAYVAPCRGLCKRGEINLYHCLKFRHLNSLVLGSALVTFEDADTWHNVLKSLAIMFLPVARSKPWGRSIFNLKMQTTSGS